MYVPLSFYADDIAENPTIEVYVSLPQRTGFSNDPFELINILKPTRFIFTRQYLILPNTAILQQSVMNMYRPKSNTDAATGLSTT